MNKLKAFIYERMPSAHLQQEFQEQLVYHVVLDSATEPEAPPAADGTAPRVTFQPVGRVSHHQQRGVPLRWSQLFAIMEDARRVFPLEDYAISQTTLEQEFMSLHSKSKR